MANLQEYLVSYGVKVDESAVNRLYAVLDQNRRKAAELKDTFTRLTESVKTFAMQAKDVPIVGDVFQTAAKSGDTVRPRAEIASAPKNESVREKSTDKAELNVLISQVVTAINSLKAEKNTYVPEKERSLTSESFSRLFSTAAQRVLTETQQHESTGISALSRFLSSQSTVSEKRQFSEETQRSTALVLSRLSRFLTSDSLSVNNRQFSEQTQRSETSAITQLARFLSSASTATENRLFSEASQRAENINFSNLARFSQFLSSLVSSESSSLFNRQSSDHKSSVEAFSSSRIARLSELFQSNEQLSDTKGITLSKTLKLLPELDTSGIVQSLVKLQKSNKLKLNADTSGITSAASSAISGIRNMVNNLDLSVDVKTNVQAPKLPTGISNETPPSSTSAIGTTNSTSIISSTNSTTSATRMSVLQNAIAGIKTLPAAATAIAGYATGGRISSPQRINVAEDGDPEYIIPIRKTPQAIPLILQMLSELSDEALESVRNEWFSDELTNHDVSNEYQTNFLTEVTSRGPKGSRGRSECHRIAQSATGSPVKVAPAGAKSPLTSIFKNLDSYTYPSITISDINPITYNNNTSHNISAPCNIDVHSSGPDPDTVGTSVYDAIERHLLTTLKGAFQ